jgi:preprotein translocase subunit YajC
MTQQQMSWAIVLVGYIVILILFYIFIVKPRRDAMKRHRDLIQNLAVGDVVVTAGGIHGRVISVHDKTCVVEIAAGTRVTLERGAVRARQEGGS